MPRRLTIPRAFRRRPEACRVNRGTVDAFDPYAEEPGTVPGFGNTYTDPANNAMLEYRRILGDRTVSTTRFGFTSYARDILPENDGTNVGAPSGVGWLNVPARDYACPAMTMAGYSRVAFFNR